MTPFWAAAAGLVVVGLAFILAPLLRPRAPADPSRDEANLAIYRERMTRLEQELEGETREEAREELLADLQRELTNPPATASGRGSGPLLSVCLAAGVPMAAFLLYLGLGETPLVLPGAADPAAAPAADSADPADPVGAPSLAQAVARLEGRLAANPQDLEGWRLLARSHVETGDLDAARDALERGLRALADDPELLIAYAEVLARQQNNQLAGRPAALLRRAVAQVPAHPKGLWLAGIAALQEGQPREALARWGQLRQATPLSAEDSTLLHQFEERAQAALEAGPARTETSRPPATRAAPASPAPGLEVRVSLDPSMSERTRPDDTVFIYARAANGPRMPLAVVAKRVEELPVTVTLDDGRAMVPAMKLSSFERVVVGARVSRTGDATPSPGDLMGLTGELVRSETSRVLVTIDRLVE